MEYKISRMNLPPCHPGLFVQTEVIEELGLEIPQIAEILGVPEAEVSDFVEGKSRLSPDLALRLEKAFELKMSLLLDIQAWYDAEQMRARWDEVKVERHPAIEELMKLKEKELALLDGGNRSTSGWRQLFRRNGRG